MNLSMEDDDDNSDQVIYPIEEPWEEAPPAPLDTGMSPVERLFLAGLGGSFLAMALWVLYGVWLLVAGVGRFLWHWV